MIKVLIADDEAPARLKLARWLAEHDDLQLVGEADNGLAALQLIAELKPDLVLLDIQMPGHSGLEVAAQLDADASPLLVFVTAYDEHAIKAFELAALDYLLKPYDKQRLQKMLERVRARLASGERADAAVATARQLQQARCPLTHLVVPVGERLQVIDADTIDWIESDDNYVHLHIGSGHYSLRRTLVELLAQLDPQRFVRIHKSAAVNIAAIASLEPLFKGDYEVKLRSGKALRLSRRFKDQALVLLGKKVPLTP
ncbi:MAG TPA: LytTR family DNA-binding domain-containing protein [Candidatus Acidoferrum sp.]|nr:LytTR family DNA-binding domain-containing protein [Candidatus Acidoferrum sp.]